MSNNDLWILRYSRKYIVDRILDGDKPAHIVECTKTFVVREAAIAHAKWVNDNRGEVYSLKHYRLIEDLDLTELVIGKQPIGENSPNQ